MSKKRAIQEEAADLIGDFDTESTEDTNSHPYSGLDYKWLSLDPSWGKEATYELSTKLAEKGIEPVQGKDGKMYYSANSMWGLLSMYRRDLRLGNLNPMTGEVQYCTYWLDSAGIYLRRGLPRSFLSAMSKAISVLEISQSKGGFLRKNEKTQTKRWEEGPQEKPRKSGLLGGKEAY